MLFCINDEKYLIDACVFLVLGVNKNESAYTCKHLMNRLYPASKFSKNLWFLHHEMEPFCTSTIQAMYYAKVNHYTEYTCNGCHALGGTTQLKILSIFHNISIYMNTHSTQKLWEDKSKWFQNLLGYFTSLYYFVPLPRHKMRLPHQITINILTSKYISNMICKIIVTYVLKINNCVEVKSK